MRGDELLDLFEDLDEELIEEAAEATILQAPVYKKRRTLLIACVCALLALSFPMVLLFSALFLEDAPVTNAGKDEEASNGIEESEPGEGWSEDGQHSDNGYISGENSFYPPEESVAPVEPMPSVPLPDEQTITLTLQALSSVSLQIKEGVVCAVQGENESGKALLAGLELEGLSYPQALNTLFSAMMKKGEFVSSRLLTLSLVSENMDELTKEEKEILEQGARTLEQNAESNGNVVKIVVTPAV